MISHFNLNTNQLCAIDNMVKYHGIEKTIDFYLDAWIESLIYNEYIINALKYLSTKL